MPNQEKKPKIGLLPLYLELYDCVMPQAREKAENFYDTIVSELEKRGVEVVRSNVCRLRAETEEAVDKLVQNGADLLVTLHLAYSPSLESVDTLARLRLPLVVLDTTPAFGYGPRQDPGELMYNHGIHGVQDLCNMLLRKGKHFQLEVGHWEKSDVLDRVVDWAKAALLVTKIRRGRVGLIGRPFDGMGDFMVSPDILRGTIGIETVTTDFASLTTFLPEEGASEVREEIEWDLMNFAAPGLTREAHVASARASLAVRRWVDLEEANAFTFNFANLRRSAGFPTAPFLEASKAMASGKGYAGEGDILTAALVGALVSRYPGTTFTEMFCPDWEGDTILLSHMGEINLRLSDGKPTLVQKEMPWIDAECPPIIPASRLRGGNAVLVNLAPASDDEYRLILAPVRVVQIEGEDTMTDSIRGWLSPPTTVSDFLREFSRAGGTHHSALAYDAPLEELVRFGKLMNWDLVVIK